MNNSRPSWLSDSCWDNITELNKMRNFKDIMESFEQYPKDWNQWFTSDEPENATLPGGLEAGKFFFALEDNCSSSNQEVKA